MSHKSWPILGQGVGVRRTHGQTKLSNGAVAPLKNSTPILYGIYCATGPQLGQRSTFVYHILIKYIIIA